MVLPKQREEDKEVPSYPDHGGLNSGEVTLMAAVAGNGQCALTKTQLAQLRGGGGRGGHGRAMVKM